MLRAGAQNLLAQKPDGLYLFNLPCLLVEGRDIMHTAPAEFRRLTSVLKEVGSLRTLAGKDRWYTFYRDLPIYAEAHRPPRYHQTVPFTIRGRDVRRARVALRFHQIAERNPHAVGAYRQNPIVPRGLLKYYLNGREVPASAIRRQRVPAGRIRSGFRLRAHEVLTLRVPGRLLRDGVNTLAVEMPKFPAPRDPYVFLYELEADIAF